MDTVEGRLISVRHHSPARRPGAGVKFLVGHAVQDGLPDPCAPGFGTSVKIKGDMQVAVIGQTYRWYGEWRPGHPRWDTEDRVFAFDHFIPLIERAPNGISYYLSESIRGVGRSTADAIVAHLGLDTFEILRADPGRAAEVPGVGEKTVAAIRKHFAEEVRFDPHAYARLIEMFSGQGLPKRLPVRCLEAWDSSAPDVVEANPYLLIQFPGVGWDRADTVAVGRLGYDERGLDRQVAAIVEGLELHCRDGHTYATAEELADRTAGLLGFAPDAAAWAAASASAELVEDGGLWAPAKLFRAECLIAHHLARLMACQVPALRLDCDGLNEGQTEAVRLIETSPVVILVGSPGTGKSFATARAIASMVAGGMRSIKVLTPTGKAAKRVDELLAAHVPPGIVECSTIHRALGPVPSGAEVGVPGEAAKMGRGREEFTFSRDASDPIPAKFIAIDETSMCDVGLLASTLDAVRSGTRLLIVGDPHQLPSVGPGSALRDMLTAAIPTVTLTEIRRNSGDIVRACHAIKDGKVPRPSPRIDIAAGHNWGHIEIDDPAAIAARIVELHANAKHFDPLWGMQVVSPQLVKPAFICCGDLNRLLSPVLNPPPLGGRPGDGDAGDDDADGDGEDGPGVPFVVGDKVIRKKNGVVDGMESGDPAGGDGPGGTRVDWHWRGRGWRFTQCPVVNGDMGTVKDIVVEGRESWVVVEFRTPERLCRMAYHGCHLVRAYAITCHSAQGSGFPLVIVPVHKSFRMWNRELYYTIKSRVEQLGITVGQFDAIPMAIRRVTIGQRRTRLAGRLGDALAAVCGV